MIQKFKNKKWYRQGGLIVPFFECPAMKTMAEILGNDGYAGIYRGERNHGYFNKEKLKELAYFHINKQLKDITHIDGLYSEWKKFAIMSLELVNKKAPLNELIPVLEDFWRTSWVIEFYDPYGEIIAKENLSLDHDKFTTILSPTAIPKMQEEHLKLLKLSLDAKADIDKHQKEFYFIKASWADAPEYTVEEIKNKIQELKKKPAEEIKKEIENIEEHYEQIKQKKKEITAKLNDKEKRITYFFEKLTDWRDERKVYVQKANCYLQQYLISLEKKTDIELKYLKFLNAYHIDDELDLNLLKEREKECVDLMDNDGNWVYLTGKQAKEIISIIESEFASGSKELRGMCASKGHVKATVSVIMKSEDFEKFKEGDVLVAASTRPEFAPLMKKASAIVTDEGGITSHAAIVSRELGVPCVIGAQKATSTLKDGMLVEVDADKGVVRILED